MTSISVRQLIGGSFAALAFVAAGASAHPETIQDRFFAVARASDMVAHCRHLDSRVWHGAAARARNAEALLDRTARRRGFAQRVQAARQDWARQRAGVDTSCLVGPGQTRRSAYLALVRDFEHELALTRALLASLPDRKRS